MIVLALLAGFAAGIACTLGLMTYKPPPMLRDDDIIEDAPVHDDSIPESIRARMRKGLA
jgi:hypothetical protein